MKYILNKRCTVCSSHIKKKDYIDYDGKVFCCYECFIKYLEHLKRTEILKALMNK